MHDRVEVNWSNLHFMRSTRVALATSVQLKWNLSQNTPVSCQHFWRSLLSVGHWDIFLNLGFRVCLRCREAFPLCNTWVAKMLVNKSAVDLGSQIRDSTWFNYQLLQVQDQSCLVCEKHGEQRQHGIAPSGFQGAEAEWQAEFDGFKQECIQVALFLWVGKGGVFSLWSIQPLAHDVFGRGTFIVLWSFPAESFLPLTSTWGQDQEVEHFGVSILTKIATGPPGPNLDPKLWEVPSTCQTWSASSEGVFRRLPWKILTAWSMKLGRANSQRGCSSLGHSTLAIRMQVQQNLVFPNHTMFHTFVSRPEDESDSGCYCSDAELRSLLESLPSVSRSPVPTRSLVDSLMYS